MRPPTPASTIRRVSCWPNAGPSATCPRPSGLLLLSVQAGEMVENPVFLLKMGLVIAADLNALAFHASPRWLTDGMQAPRARLHAVLSLLFRVAVIVCARMLAYV